MRYKFLRFPQGKVKAVTLSYDDGRYTDIRFSDVITKAGLKCTFNLCSQKQIKDLTAEQKKEYFLDRGHEIAVHCAQHRAPGMQRAITGIKDVLDCRLELEEEYGLIIRGMAYPDTGIRYFANEATYENIKHYLTDLDIAYARTLGKDNNSFSLPNDWHAWMPTAHHANPKLLEYIEEFLNIEITPDTYGPTHHPKLFYIWGHSIEFERDNNWELLDKICERLGGRDDIWYATNMEIYEYVKAYDSIIYSADETKMYNPSLFDIWMDIDGEVICIKSGETKTVSK